MREAIFWLSAILALIGSLALFIVIIGTIVFDIIEDYKENKNK